MPNVNYVINGISGIWNSYGCPPNAGESVTISIEDSEEGESLKDLCGFDSSPKEIGTIADSKEISELVVLLPTTLSVRRYIGQPYIPTDQVVPEPGDPCVDCSEKDPCGDDDIQVTDPKNTDNKNFKTLYWSETESAYLFTINSEVINKILGVDNFRKLHISRIKEILENKVNINKENSIVKMMLAMTKYNFPPHLNWLLFPTIPPIGMYVAEFKHTLSKNDLSNIWQGTMPKIAQEPEEEEIDLEYFLGDEEVFEGYDIERYIINLRIFKCKKRAANDYKIDAIAGSESFRTFRFANEFNKKWYRSNWPYDNFSLVELLKIEAGEVREEVNTQKYGVLLPDVTTVNPDGSLGFSYSDSILPFREFQNMIKGMGGKY